MERVVPRVVYKEVVPSGVRVLRLHTIFGRERSYRVESFSITLKGLVVNRPPTPDAEIIGYGASIEVVHHPWMEYCRWHSGPLDQADDLASRLYCTSAARGFCRQHKRSPRALYEECFGGGGERGLWACRALDDIVKTEYTVYLTVFPSPSKPVKVGVTRRFRLLDRLAEQPHIAATIVATVDSAYRARRIELDLSRRGVARQSTRKSGVARGLRRLELLASLESAALEASRMAGEKWDGRLYSVQPPPGLKDPVSPAPGLRFRLEHYWGGLLGGRSEEGPEVWLRASDLLHRDSLSIP